MIPLGPVVGRLNTQAERATVWAYLVSRARRALWWPELDLTPRVGGEVSERWAEGEGDERVSRDASGDVDVVVPEHALGFRWKEAGDARTTAVLITLRTIDDGTAITVTETGFDTLADAAARAAASQDGWNILLRDLAAAAEGDTGEFPEDEEATSEHDEEPAPQPEDDADDTADAPDAPDVADTAQAADAADTAQTTDTAQSTDTAETAQATDAAESVDAAESTGTEDAVGADDTAETADTDDTADTAEIELDPRGTEESDFEVDDAQAVDAEHAHVGDPDTEVIEAELIEDDVIDEDADGANDDVIDAEPEVVIDFDELIRGPR